MTWEHGDDHVADEVTGVLRICADLCPTCIYRPGNLMDLDPGRVQEMTRSAIADEGHVVCHSTLGTPAPAICAGFERHPQGGARSLALRFAAARLLRVVRITPPGKEAGT